MKWILHCARCDGVLIHSEIRNTDLLDFDSYVNLKKPEFPLGGLNVFCPNCNETAIYQRHQLVYQKS
jgi:hypothetical protein